MANHIVTEVTLKKIFRQQEGVSSIGLKGKGALPARRFLIALATIGVLALLLHPQQRDQSASALALSTPVYLPYIAQNHTFPKTPMIHMPFIDDDNSYNLTGSRLSELGVFWFGKVTPNENYSDVRVGYNKYTIVADIATIDQQLWYDAGTPPSKNFNAWDSASIFLSIPGESGQAESLLRLDAMTSYNKWSADQRITYQNAYRWNGTQWSPIDFRFSTDQDYRGLFNERGEDEGWNITFRIPFSSLGLPRPPASGSSLRMGIVVYDRDTTSGGAINKSWPEGFKELQTSSYGQLTFGYPVFRKPANPKAGSVTIRQSSTDTVEDASVGGYATCGNNGFNKWTEWGDRVWNTAPENQAAVVQNQRLIADWPCFSRYYVTFPLSRIPQGKVILSAKLTLTHFGGSDLSNAKPSYIQILRIDQPWSPSTISWNNAPQAVENYHPGTWVPPYNVGSSGSPGVIRTWDVTQALMDVYSSGEPLRLALYSADSAMHSGKYFRSSETAAWGGAYPPTLTIEWGNP